MVLSGTLLPAGILRALIDKLPNVVLLEVLLPIRIKLPVSFPHKVRFAVTAKPHPDHISSLAIPLRHLPLNMSLMLPELHVAMLERPSWSTSVILLGDPLPENTLLICWSSMIGSSEKSTKLLASHNVSFGLYFFG